MFETVAKMLAEQLGIPASKVTMESDIVKDLNADSLDVVELLMAMEEETGKTIPEESISGIHTVGDLIKVLESL